MLEESMRHQDEKLLTDEFVSIEGAARLLGVQTHTVERRVRERSILTLRGFANTEPRIPVWTLSIRRRDMKALLAEVGDSHWHLYGFLREGIGGLSALTPEVMLVPLNRLGRVPRAYRQDLAERLTARGETLITTIVGVLRDQVQHTDGSGFG